MTTLKQDIAAIIADADIPLTASSTDAEILAWYETEIAVDRAQTSGDVWSALAKQNDFSFAALRNASADPAHPAQELALRAWSLLSDRNKMIDFTDAAEAAAFTGALDALVTAGFMTAGHRTAVLAIFAEDVPRWQARGLSKPKVGYIQMARA